MSNNALKTHDRLLREHGFVEVRSTRHRIFRNPQGKVYVTAATPSDWRVGHQMLTSLRRVIANPAKPMVIAIADYEREAAAAKIAAQPKAVQGISGGASRGRGTGFIYYDNNDKVLTVEQIARREEVRARAHANEEARRQKKLARKAEQEEAARISAIRAAEHRAAEAERLAAEEKRIEHLRPFIDLAKYSTTKFHELCVRKWRWALSERPWDVESNYFPYPFRDLGELQFARTFKEYFEGESFAGIEKRMVREVAESAKFQPPALNKFLETAEKLIVEYDGSFSHIADQLSDKLTNDEPRSFHAFFKQEVYELMLALLESLEGAIERFAHEENVVEPDSDNFVILASGNQFLVVNTEDEDRTSALEFPPQDMLDKHIARVWLVAQVGTEEVNIYHGGFPLTDIPEFAAAVADEEEEAEVTAA